MPREPIFGLRLDAETKARWIAAAHDRGYPHLGEFVKACVEGEIASGYPSRRSSGLRGRVEVEETRADSPPPTVPPPVRPAGPSAPTMGEKRSYEPDFKAESTRKKK